MLVATKFAIETMRKMLGNEGNYKTLVLGSTHGLEFTYDKQIDWSSRGVSGNVNFEFDKINSGDWNLVINCCCEHMYPMSEIKLPATYVLQSNNRYGDTHINRVRSFLEFAEQINLDEIYYYNCSRFDGADYFTIIGEKW